ncbi:LicD family protein [Neobacillus drentensis]|uniref:LicD family protein n=1 Tax=Neobacillus drentensis TaxID=220684 RepID=UPI002FFE7662
MDNLLKEVFFKLGVYEFAKKYLRKPYVKMHGLIFKFSAKKALKKLIQTMNQNKYKYWLEFGTLLGAIREKGFISHDHDIDIAMYIQERDETLEQLLTSKGFKLKKRAKLLTGEIIEETYKYKTANIDIFYAYKMDNQIKIFDYQTFYNLSPNECIKQYGGLRVYENVLTEFDLIKSEFYDLDVLIPSNIHIHLGELYGKDYMIKNKNWKFDSSSVRKETTNLAVINYF